MAALRGCLVGCGFFSANHLHAWAEVEGATITGVCDLDPARAVAARDRHGIAQAYADAADMLDRERPDFLDIVTTVDTHEALVDLAASRGIAVICQKPFARDLATARAMVDACAAAGVPLMVHENFRFQPPIAAVAEALGQGRIGTPTYARISFRHAYDVYVGQPYLRTEARLALLDLGIHLLDVARALLGEAVDLHCIAQRVNPGVAGEDVATVTLGHAGGAVSVIDMSFATVRHPDPFPQTTIRIEGDRGTLELLEGYHLAFSTPGHREERSVEPAVPAWGARPWHVIQASVTATQRHFVDALLRGEEPATSGADNLATLALTLAAYGSAASGHTVAMAASKP